CRGDPGRKARNEKNRQHPPARIVGIPTPHFHSFRIVTSNAPVLLPATNSLKPRNSVPSRGMIIGGGGREWWGGRGWRSGNRVVRLPISNGLASSTRPT